MGHPSLLEHHPGLGKETRGQSQRMDRSSNLGVVKALSRVRLNVLVFTGLRLKTALKNTLSCVGS